MGSDGDRLDPFTAAVVARSDRKEIDEIVIELTVQGGGTRGEGPLPSTRHLLVEKTSFFSSRATSLWVWQDP